MERAKGFEPSTPTLARLCSTPELRPLTGADRKPQMRGSCRRGGAISSALAHLQALNSLNGPHKFGAIGA